MSILWTVYMISLLCAIAGRRARSVRGGWAHTAGVASMLASAVFVLLCLYQAVDRNWFLAALLLLLFTQL